MESFGSTESTSRSTNPIQTLASFRKTKNQTEPPEVIKNMFSSMPEQEIRSLWRETRRQVCRETFEERLNLKER